MTATDWIEIPGFLPFALVLVGLLGAMIGSFLNVCIYRIPRDESVVAPGSHCPVCMKPIPWYHNIPIFTWLILRGRGACCNTKISPRYLIVEVTVAVFFLLVAFKCVNGLTDASWLGLGPIINPALLPAYWLFAAGLVVGTFVDFEHLIIPDRITLGGIVAGVLLSALIPEMHNVHSVKAGLFFSALGAAAGWGILWAIAVLGSLAFRKEAMGFGDVKLLGGIGAFIGWQGVLFTIFASSLIGSMAGITLIIVKKKELQSKIPYGPFLALGALVWLFWGPTLADFYIGLMTPDYAGL
ncbi:MAG: prepilin peptidase [Verrucomicrobia bacterium]|nr:prepilin peptidase [Verrucomicrobiota bacterium]